MMDFFIGENNYIERMKSEAEPYIKSRRSEAMLFREPGCFIYTVFYTPENPTAAVLISHGFTETTEKYRELIYYFLRSGYAVCIFDHCGHGKSYRMTGHAYKVHIDSYERYVDDLLFVADRAKERYKGLRLFMYGHSMGGGVAAAAAAHDNRIFDRLVLSSPMIRPATGGVPWGLTRLLCRAFCAAGRAESYVMGQGPYKGNERFEESASVSLPRFEYYQELRRTDILCQMSGATYGWLDSAVKLSGFLMNEACRSIACPVLLFQAEDDSFVINEIQDKFIEKIEESVPARLVRMPGTRHEIFNSHDDTVREYFSEIINFLGE